MKRLFLFLGCLLQDFSVAFNLSEALYLSYTGLLQRNINEYALRLVHRPYSEFPNDIVSEGLGYGLLCSLYFDDYETFQTLITNGERMWNGYYYNWHFDEYGNLLDTGGATDAEEDIALSLIFATRKMDRNEWPSENKVFYIIRAQEILDNMWSNPMISPNGYICPGSNWGCDTLINLSYFAPAWYRIFSLFDQSSDHDWTLVIDQNYNLLESTIGYQNGMVPDWSTTEGTYVAIDSLGYNAYGDGRYFFKDAIRILFRIGVDFLWFNNERARNFIENAKDFIIDGTRANFYSVEGGELPTEDIWVFDGGNRHRKRREHSHMTIAMWSIPITLLGNQSQKKSFMDELGLFYEVNKTYWGKTNDPINQEDIEHNEMYFDQFLAIFGALIMNGSFVNLF